MHGLRVCRARGFTLIEVLVVMAIILIIMGIVTPHLPITKMQALELGALKAIGTIHVAQAQYQTQYGRYAATLAELGPPAAGAGRRTFYSDQTLITHQNSTAEPASAASPEIDPK